jgi:thymidylate synthase (FAD)
LLSENVAPEQARAVLPQTMYTNWIWSGTLYAFARVCGLRLDDHAQKETQEIAKQIDIHCQDAFPISWKYLTKTNFDDIVEK